MASVSPLHQSTSGQSRAHPLQLHNHPTGSRPSHLPPGPFISLLSLPRSPRTHNSTQQSKKSLKHKAYHTANSCPPPPNSFIGFQLIQGQILISSPEPTPIWTLPTSRSTVTTPSFLTTSQHSDLPFVRLGTEPRTSFTKDKNATTQPQPQPLPLFVFSSKSKVLHASRPGHKLGRLPMSVTAHYPA